MTTSNTTPEAGCWETVTGEGARLVERLKTLIHEGNARRIVVEHEGRTIAEFPLTAGVVGAVIAPVAAAVGALVAMLKDCTIKVQRDTTGGDAAGPSSQDTTRRGAA